MKASKLLKFALPPLILLASVGVAAILVTSGDQAEKSEPVPRTVAVEVLTVQTSATVPVVEATGLVQPAKRVDLVPQVGGQVVEISEKLMPGGRFEEGEVIGQVDPRDYNIAIRAARSQMKGAELELKLERGRSAIAAREWKLLGVQDGEENAAQESALALRKPHLAVAQYAYQAAKGGLERAKLDLERATLTAPFNAMVVQKNVDVGQVVGPGTPLATLVGTDTFWVMVSLPVEKLTTLQIPQVNAIEGSSAIVSQQLPDGRTILRAGRLLQLAGQLDAMTRNAQVIVAVEQPLQPGSDGTGLPLLPGAYVKVQLSGAEMPSAISLPRPAVHDGNSVWLAIDDRLTKRSVAVAEGDAKHVIITAGLEPGDQVITTPLPVPIEGAPVHIIPTEAL